MLASTPPGPPDWTTIANTLLGANNPWAQQVAGLMNADINNPQVKAIQQMLFQNESALGNRLGASGMGDSTRAALESGAIGADAAGALASAQNQALQNLMSGELGSGQLNLEQQQQAEQALRDQYGFGGGLLGQENTEFGNMFQGLGDLINFLTNFGNQFQTGFSATR